MNQLNPSITSPRDGARSRNKSPRDITGRRRAELLQEKAAREEAANIDVAEVQRQAREAGYLDGWNAGFTAGWDALAAHLVTEGILAPDDDDEPAEDE